jgi:hypothetical protein
VADEQHFSSFEVDSVKVMVSENLANGVVGCREGEDQVEEVSEISPEDLLFECREPEGGSRTLLSGASPFGRLQIVSGEFVTEPLEAVGSEIVAEELDGIGVR